MRKSERGRDGAESGRERELVEREKVLNETKKKREAAELENGKDE